MRIALRMTVIAIPVIRAGIAIHGNAETVRWTAMLFVMGLALCGVVWKGQPSIL